MHDRQAGGRQNIHTKIYHVQNNWEMTGAGTSKYPGIMSKIPKSNHQFDYS